MLRHATRIYSCGCSFHFIIVFTFRFCCGVLVSRLDRAAICHCLSYCRRVYGLFQRRASAATSLESEDQADIELAIQILPTFPVCFLGVERPLLSARCHLVSRYEVCTLRRISSGWEGKDRFTSAKLLPGCIRHRLCSTTHKATCRVYLRCTKWVERLGGAEAGVPVVGPYRC